MTDSMIKDKLKWVKQKLVENPSLRDSNERLYYNYLVESGYDMNKNVKDFLKDMSERKISYLDSIGRCSRKVQEDNPELRGELWNKRKIKAMEVREEILTINNEGK